MNISQSLGMKPSNELIDLNSVVFKFDSKSVAIQFFGFKKMVVGKKSWEYENQSVSRSNIITFSLRERKLSGASSSLTIRIGVHICGAPNHLSLSHPLN
jgi:hypothetical protein